MRKDGRRARQFSCYVAVTLLVVVPLFADAATRCQRLATKQMTAFDKELAKTQAKFAERHDRLVDNFLQGIADPQHRSELAAALDAVVDEFQLDEILSLSQQKKTELEAFVASDGSGDCIAGDGPEYVFDRTIEVLGINHETALEALQDRIGIEDVGPNEGLVVLAMFIDGPVMRLTLDKRGSMTGARAFNNVRLGQFFRVIKLPAGEYQWTTVRSQQVFTRNYWADREVYYFDMRDEDLAFRVEPGKLNFTGVFTFSGSVNRARWDLKDRASIVMRIVENRHPELLERYPVFNGAIPDDEFLQFFVEQRRLTQEATR